MYATTKKILCAFARSIMPAMVFCGRIKGNKCHHMFHPTNYILGILQYHNPCEILFLSVCVCVCERERERERLRQREKGFLNPRCFTGLSKDLCRCQSSNL
uniref:Uncharacterized protein n=1 Tax=Micrurus lemniscatus lemniscatus TaxID=129467 RepID=A0A2D4I1Z0_MICLE